MSSGIPRKFPLPTELAHWPVYLYLNDLYEKTCRLVLYVILAFAYNLIFSSSVFILAFQTTRY